MFIFALFTLSLVALVIMERKGILGDSSFAVAIVLLLSAAAGYLGVSNY